MELEKEEAPSAPDANEDAAQQVAADEANALSMIEAARLRVVVQERDRLWALALINSLSTDDLQRVLTTFLELRKRRSKAT